jgi:hypothetical protein
VVRRPVLLGDQADVPDRPERLNLDETVRHISHGATIAPAPRRIDVVVVSLKITTSSRRQRPSRLASRSLVEHVALRGVEIRLGREPVDRGRRSGKASIPSACAGPLSRRRLYSFSALI